MKTIIVPLLVLALSGCAHQLPAVSGKSVEYVRTDPLGGTTISAQRVVITDDEVNAERVVWDTKYPLFHIRLTVEGYSRKRTLDKSELDAAVLPSNTR